MKLIILSSREGTSIVKQLEELIFSIQSGVFRVRAKLPLHFQFTSSFKYPEDVNTETGLFL